MTTVFNRSHFNWQSIQFRYIADIYFISERLSLNIFSIKAEVVTSVLFVSFRQLVHRHVIDTSLLYRREFGQRFKLKVLAETVLK